LTKLLRKNNIAPVDNDQIKRFLVKIRKLRRIETTGTDKIEWSLQNIVDFAQSRLEIPELDDQVFVAVYEVSPLPIKKFRIFLTTKRLISNARHVIF
jgi:hypothetical protein